MTWVVSFSILRPFGLFPVNTMLRAGEEEIPAVERIDTALLLRLLSGAAHVLLALRQLPLLERLIDTLPE